MYFLRPALESDQPRIRRLIREVRINPTGLNWRRFSVAVTPENDLIGCGQVKPHWDGSLELASIAVHPDWRRRGVARAIIEDLLEKHPGSIYLTCRASLGPFYRKFDFHAILPSQMPAYFRGVYHFFRGFRMLGLAREDLLVMKRW